MATQKHILAICGSTRHNSANQAIIRAVASLSQEHLIINLYEGLTRLPYFNQDVSDADTPSEVKSFREAIQQANGVLICTPEYVFSMPGILKNALEWTVSTTVFSDKPTALITASSSGEKAHESLLLVMKTLGIKTTDDMCLLISGVKSKLNAQGDVQDDSVLEKIKKLTEGFN